MNELLAPTKYIAALWAVGFLLFVAGWCLWSSRRLGKLVDQIRHEDQALWQELGAPQGWDDVGNARNWSTLRRLRTDHAFAQQFNQQVIADLRDLQQAITIGLIVMAGSGLLVMYLVWPHK